MLDHKIQSCYLWPVWFRFGYNMDKFESMDAFTKVVATRSFAEAGRRLGLTR